MSLNACKFCQQADQQQHQILYLGEHLNYKECPDLAFPVDGGAESLFVEINRTKEKNVIVGVLYRPSDSNLFWVEAGVLYDVLGRSVQCDPRPLSFYHFMHVQLQFCYLSYSVICVQQNPTKTRTLCMIRATLRVTDTACFNILKQFTHNCKFTNMFHL